MSDDDRIVKTIDLAAPPARVWRALTDADEFGRWFRVALDQPFEPGALSTGRMTYPGCEGMPWRATVERMEHERLFSFRWHDADPASSADVAEQPTTRVEFRLEPIATGTRLTITESGFSSLGDARRLEVLRSNTQGWDIQSTHLRDHLAADGAPR